MKQHTTSRVPAARLRAPRGGFTLIELLTVVAIVVVLAGLSLGIFAAVGGKSDTAKTRAQLALLENAIQKYHADVGVYPEATGDGSAEESLIIYRMAFGDGIGEDGVVGTDDDGMVDGEPDRGASIHVPELDPNEGGSTWYEEGQLPPRALLDIWGLPWRYRSGNDPNAINPDFDLWSSGPDGLSNPVDPKDSDNTDDITNW